MRIYKDLIQFACVRGVLTMSMLLGGVVKKDNSVMRTVQFELNFVGLYFIY